MATVKSPLFGFRDLLWQCFFIETGQAMAKSRRFFGKRLYS
jgi:hypothetical protein